MVSKGHFLPEPERITDQKTRFIHIPRNTGISTCYYQKINPGIIIYNFILICHSFVVFHTGSLRFSSKICILVTR